MSIAGWESSRPQGTEDRCCFVCAKSSTNIGLLASDRENFTPHARITGTVKCLAHNQRMNSLEVCAGYVDTAHFEWPELPPRTPLGTT